MEDGVCPVKDFIDGLNLKNRAKITAWIDKLEELGPNLPRPFADLLEDGIHELRVKLSGSQIRVLYFFCYQKNIVLSNQFIKNTEKVPREYIEIAKKCRFDFKKRFKGNTPE